MHHVPIPVHTGAIKKNAQIKVFPLYNLQCNLKIFIKRFFCTTNFSKFWNTLLLIKLIVFLKEPAKGDIFVSTLNAQLFE